MGLKTISIYFIMMLTYTLAAQEIDSINQTDMNGKKQGHWIKKNPNGNLLYEGYFKDDMPTGVFKRFFENNQISSVLIFSNFGKEAQATL
jgi:antitoxin component YwqK of YwqJK toxin-antitoxin module